MSNADDVQRRGLELQDFAAALVQGCQPDKRVANDIAALVTEALGNPYHSIRLFLGLDMRHGGPKRDPAFVQTVTTYIAYSRHERGWKRSDARKLGAKKFGLKMANLYKILDGANRPISTSEAIERLLRVTNGGLKLPQFPPKARLSRYRRIGK